MSEAIVSFDPENVNEALELAKALAPSSLLPAHLRGKPADVLVVVLTGRELGLSPMQSIRGMYVVNGKAAISADLMVGLAVSKPQCRYFRLIESTGTTATYETLREGSEPVRLSFTLAQAKTAGLLTNATWAKYPDAMLRARASSALARAVYPDLLAGVYEQGELQHVEKDVTPSRPAPIRGVVRDDDAPAPPAALLAQNTPAVEVDVEPAHDVVTGEVVEAEPRAEAFERMKRELSAGFADWKAKRAWRTANKEAKDALPMDMQLELSAAFNAASPEGLKEVKP